MKIFFKIVAIVLIFVGVFVLNQNIISSLTPDVAKSYYDVVMNKGII